MNDNTYGNRVNLEGIFYDENGSFTPLTDSHGNTNGTLAELRDTYMNAERAYFEELLTDQEIRDYFLKMVDNEPEYLFSEAQKLQERLEYGILENEEERKMMAQMPPKEREEYHMRKLERAEGTMCLLFAAAKDKVKVLELVKTRTR